MREPIDVSNSVELEAEAAHALSGIATERLMAAERQAEVADHMVLSRVGLNRVELSGHYAASEAFRPGPRARIAATTFEDLLEGRSKGP
jgi:hypothetical protein